VSQCGKQEKVKEIHVKRYPYDDFYY